MLAIISDLHLSDGSTTRTFDGEAFDVVAERVESAARSRGARELGLVLLGDIFDLVRTDYWLDAGIPPDERPWGGVLDPVTGMNRNAAECQRQYEAVLERALAANAPRSGRGLGPMLARLEEGADRLGIPFQATYIPGNHDRILHNFPSLRRRLQLAFPQIGAFDAVYRGEGYDLLARHGHEWDGNCHGLELVRRGLDGPGVAGRFDPAVYRVMAIGEVVTAELMSGLIHHARRMEANAELVERLRDVHHLSPMLGVFEWLEWFGGRESPAQQEILHAALERALDAVLGSSVAASWDRLKRDVLVSGDLVDRLQLARTLLLGDGFPQLRRRARRAMAVHHLLPAREHLLEGAAREFREGTVPPGTQFLVYGHTHRARHDYFHGETDGRVRMYVNSGAFLPVIARAADRRSFVSELQMTVVFAFRADEGAPRGGGQPSLEIWQGVRRPQPA